MFFFSLLQYLVSVIHPALLVTAGRNMILSMETVFPLEPVISQSLLTGCTFHTQLSMEIMQEALPKSLLNPITPKSLVHSCKVIIITLAFNQNSYEDIISHSSLQPNFIMMAYSCYPVLSHIFS